MSGLRLADVIAHCQRHSSIRASARQWQVLHHILDCRTEKLGSSAYRCASCHAQWRWHHSCRDRHCPQCQQQANAAWCDKQRQQLLPVPYFHLVFTLPHELNPWVSRHDALLYRLLFQCAWQALSGMGQRKLGGQLGMTAVLHTWGQRLTRHVHLHCLVPAGVLTARQRWRSRDKGYLLPVKALAKRFRGLLVSALRAAYQAGELAAIAALEVDRVLEQLMAKAWVVYSKSALHYRETLVRYLARYTHRIGLSNHRLLHWDGEHIALAYHDYRTATAATLLLPPEELLRRFLLHVLPKGFMRIRHYGFLANAVKARCLACIRAQLARSSTDTGAAPTDDRDDQVPQRCPRCGHRPVMRLGVARVPLVRRPRMASG